MPPSASDVLRLTTVGVDGVDVAFVSRMLALFLDVLMCFGIIW